MNNKKVIRIIAVIMAVMLVFGLVASVVPVMANAVSQDDVDALQAEKSRLAEQSDACQTKIDKLRRQKAAAIDEKAALDERSEYAEKQLALTNKQIKLYDSMIEEKAQEVDEARAREDAQLFKYRSRIRAMEENGSYNILAVILNADSFAGLLAAFDDVAEVMESDKNLEKKYTAAREHTEAVKAEYEEYKAELNAKKDELVKEKAKLEADIKEAEELIASLEEDIEKAVEEYKIAIAAEYSAAAQLDSIVAKLNAQNAAAANVQPSESTQADSGSTQVTSGSTQVTSGGVQSSSESSSGGIVTDNSLGGSSSGAQQSSSSGMTSASSAGVSGTNSFIWPVPSSMTVTSRYGMRVHPLTGQTTMHNGIDIDGYGKDGNPVVAADSGVVSVAEYSSSYGNYVLIDHGNGRQTLYAHCSGLAVSVGSTVAQGQTIGYLGATGWATGTHCHFEIFINGSRVDPASYFGGITFYDC